MFEFEEMSSGFHDGFLNKYADTSGPIYDIYISDSMQDMLDIDIRTEVATVVGGGNNEFSSIINDMPSYDDIDPICKDGDAWLGGPKWSAANDYYSDVGTCVNPNSVMPIISSSIANSSKDNLNTNNFRRTTSPSGSPRANKSHLTFSPNQIKMTSILQEKRLPTKVGTPVSQNNRFTVDSIKKDLGNQIQQAAIENEPQFEMTNAIVQSKGIISGTNTIKLAPGIGGLTFANSVTYNKLKQQSSMSKPMSTLSQNGNLILKRDRDSSPLQNMATLNNGHYNGNHHTSKILPRTIASQKKTVSLNSLHQITQSTHKINQNNNNKNKMPLGPEFPKPAYSYSCLIAMSLKNSRGGSLPVSEIYSFMCEHFPYFKTAPNGWKNSVRHNLSLNKCFEKIEKPATNGGQRKGCLWAMNPTKIAKMDEEVQKWSRKDPMAIRKAMVYPEHLEALERGEMKHGSLCDSDLELDGPSDVEGSSDSEPEQEIDEIVNETAESYIEEDEDHHSQGRDFDVDVQDIYDEIEIEDDKESLRRNLQQNGLMDDYSSPKRARFNINYSITPAGSYEQYQQSDKVHNQHIVNHHQNQQQQQQQQQHHTNIQHHNRRKVQLVNRIA